MLEFAGRFSDPKLMIKQGKYWSIIFKESTTLYEFTYAYGLSYWYNLITNQQAIRP